MPEPEVRAFPVAPEDDQAVRDRVAAKESPETWENLDSAQRAALVQIITDAFERLPRNVEEWLPGNLVVEPDGRIGVFVMFHFDHINDKVLEMRSEATRRERDTIAALQRIASGHDDA